MISFLWSESCNIKRLIFGKNIRQFKKINESTFSQQDNFSHPYLSSVSSLYERRLREYDIEQLDISAKKVISEPLLQISNKSLIAPSGNRCDYLSFAPYYWSEEHVNPLLRKTKNRRRLDGKSNPFLANLSDKPKFAQVCSRIHILTLSYVKTENKTYLEYALKQIEIWFCNVASAMRPNMEFAQIIPWSGNKRGLGLIDSRWLILLIDSVAILEAKNAIPDRIKIDLGNWLKSFSKWMITSFSGITEASRKNNRGTWADVVLCYISISLNDDEIPLLVVKKLQSRLDEQVDSTGFQPLELMRTNSVSYSLYNAYPLLYLKEIFSYYFKERDESSSLKGQVNIDGLRPLVCESEKGKIEHISYSTEFSLNLYYPYSFAQFENFPCSLPFTYPMTGNQVE